MILWGMSVCIYPQPSKYEHNCTYGYWVRMTPVFSPTEALYGCHGNQMKILHWFCKTVTRAKIWYIIHTCNVLGKLCNLIRKMGSETVKPPLYPKDRYLTWMNEKYTSYLTNRAFDSLQSVGWKVYKDIASAEAEGSCLLSSRSQTWGYSI